MIIASSAASDQSTDSGDPVDAAVVAPAPGEDRFGDLVEPLRPEIRAHCYRMLGSFQDAEDATQETLLRAWRGLDAFEGRSAIRTWLIRIATNVCLDSASSTSRRAVPMDLGPASPHAVPDGRPRVDLPWIQPYPDRALAGVQLSPHARYELLESVELAFITALQRLPANQRAALLLFDVLGYSAREIADHMDTTAAAVNSALQRARAQLTHDRPEIARQPNLRNLRDPAMSRIVTEYMTAVERGDVEAVIGLLTEDATWSMPPLTSWYRGHDAIRDFLKRMALLPDWRRVATHANGQAAVAGYLFDADRGVYTAYVLDVLTIWEGRIVDVTAFIDDSLFPVFGLALSLPARG